MELTTGLVLNVALSLGTMALVVVLGYFALRLRDPARYENEAGRSTLAALKWRELANLLIALFRARGFEPAEKERSRSSGGYDLLFTRGTARYLLQCKHGSSYRVKVADVDDFLMVIRTEGAEGGFIVTMGEVDAAAQEAVYARNVDLYDGPELWRELQTYLPREMLEQTQQRAANTRLGLMRRTTMLALLAGVLAFFGSTLLLSGADTVEAPHSVVSSAPADPAPGPTPASNPDPPSADTAAPAPIATPPRQAALPVPDFTQVQLSERRAAVVKGVRAVPGVVTADWSTNSTMLITMEGTDEQHRLAIVEAVCSQFEGYEELQWTRLQMHQFNADEESGTPVRWHQCQ